MRVINEIDVNQVNKRRIGTEISIYSLLVVNEGKYFLIGCGLWDRERMPHTKAVKDATPGIVYKIDSTSGKIVAATPRLANIVYPLVRISQDGYFIGCRTGAVYLLTNIEEMKIKQTGHFGEGIYGVAFAESISTFLIGGRNGTLYGLDKKWQKKFKMPVSDDRLWNFCLDRNQAYLYVASYNGKLFRVDLRERMVVDEKQLGAGAVTYLALLKNGYLAAGCMWKKVQLLRKSEVYSIIKMESSVCFVADHPRKDQMFVTGYKGQIWLYDYSGNLLDSFLLDSKENNPIWIMQYAGRKQLVVAWANGIIRVFEM